MPHVNGIQANLICNGIPLTEYPKPSSTPNIVFCESIPDQTFQVRLSGPKAPSDCSIRLYCDGVHMKSCSYPRRECLSITFQGIRVTDDDTKMMPFKFSTIELCEEDDSHSEQIIKNLGTVSLEFFHCKFGPLEKIKKTKSMPSLASTAKFSERHKKASMIPHTISLGQAITTNKSQSSTTRPRQQMDSSPYLRFVWHYRSRDLLTIAGLIPRPANPLPEIRLPILPPLTCHNNEPGPAQGSTPRVKAAQETKPDIKPKTSGRKPKTSGSQPVVIDLCNEVNTTSFFSSTLDNPILLDDEDNNEMIVQSSGNVNHASSSSCRQADIKPVKIETETADEGCPKEKKRGTTEVKVEESDRKRLKLEMISGSSNEKQ